MRKQSWEHDGKRKLISNKQVVNMLRVKIDQLLANRDPRGGEIVKHSWMGKQIKMKILITVRRRALLIISSCIVNVVLLMIGPTLACWFLSLQFVYLNRNLNSSPVSPLIPRSQSNTTTVSLISLLVKFISRHESWKRYYVHI
jgi:hypothetical protein